MFKDVFFLLFFFGGGRDPTIGGNSFPPSFCRFEDASLGPGLTLAKNECICSGGYLDPQTTPKNAGDCPTSIGFGGKCIFFWAVWGSRSPPSAAWDPLRLVWEANRKPNRRKRKRNGGSFGKGRVHDSPANMVLHWNAREHFWGKNTICSIIYKPCYPLGPLSVLTLEKHVDQPKQRRQGWYLCP